MIAMKIMQEFRLMVQDEQLVVAPSGWQILGAAVHNGAVLLLAVVDSEAPAEDHKISMYTIGAEVSPNPAMYVGSVVDPGPFYPLLRHIFWEPTAKGS